MAEQTMSVLEYIQKYNLPINLGVILKAVLVYKGFDPGKVTITVKPQSENIYGGTNSLVDNHITIFYPTYDHGGRVPINTILKTNEDGDSRETYIQYDSDTFAFVHEINHTILEYLGLNSDEQKRELYVAVMAAAAREAIKVGNGDSIKTVQELKKLLQSNGWNNRSLDEIAKENDASFENVFSAQSNFLSSTGLSNISDAYRRGYGFAGNWTSSSGMGFGSQLSFNGLAWLGNKENNHIVLGDESDYGDGGNGNDILRGEAGKDTLIGGAGQDTIYGGDDQDTIYGDKTDGTTPDNVNNVDTLYGNAGDDHLEGGKGEDTLRGGADSDVLLGGTETDYLYGDSGNDTLLGGDDTSTDILFGGSGEDILLAQGGDDFLAGGVSWDNLYQAVGRTVGNMIGVVTSLGTGNLPSLPYSSVGMHTVNKNKVPTQSMGTS